MPAYLIVEQTISDPKGFEDYLGQVVPTILKFGGKPLSYTSRYEVLEQQRPWQPERVVLIEFPDMTSLRGWYNSPEYEPVRGIRHQAAQTNMIALNGD